MASFNMSAEIQNILILTASLAVKALIKRRNLLTLIGLHLINTLMITNLGGGLKIYQPLIKRKRVFSSISMVKAIACSVNGMVWGLTVGD